MLFISMSCIDKMHLSLQCAASMLVNADFAIILFLRFFFLHNFRYTDTGFTVNGVKYEGSLLIIDNKLMSWSPKRFSEITAERYVWSVKQLLILHIER